MTNLPSLRCPLTQKLFEDPVIATDGYTYERKAITEWYESNSISPITQNPIQSKFLLENHVVRSIINELSNNGNRSTFQCQYIMNFHVRKTHNQPIFRAFGKTIYKAEWISKEGPAIVLIRIDGAKALREALFYIQLSSHPYIVRTFGFVESEPNSVMFVQEYASHGDLHELFHGRRFCPTEDVLIEIFLQLIEAMIYLADHRIVHGDLACRNVLVFRMDAEVPKKNLVKLTDFGLTRASSLYSITDTAAVSVMTVIPIRYAAPEILHDNNPKNYSEKSDVYSMGVLMWEACTGDALPYASIENDDEIKQRKLRGEKLPRPNCSDDLWKVMQACWHLEASKRPDFRALKDFLQYQRHQSAAEKPNEPRIRSAPVVDQTNKIDKECSCPFCSQKFPSSTSLAQHLLQCGNKTEKCPRCLQYVRRAIYRYHTENNCYNVDDSSGSNSNNQSFAERRKLSHFATMRMPKNSTRQIQCEFCGVQYSQHDITQHRANCFRNPANHQPSNSFVPRQTSRENPFERMFEPPSRPRISETEQNYHQNGIKSNQMNRPSPSRTNIPSTAPSTPSRLQRASIQNRTPRQRTLGTIRENSGFDRDENTYF